MSDYFARTVLCLAFAASTVAACGDDDDTSGNGAGTGGTAGKGGTTGDGGTAGKGGTTGDGGTVGEGGAPAGEGGTPSGQAGTPGEAGSSNGPATCLPEGDLSVTNVGFTAYEIEGDNNPDLTLCRGNTYTFQVDAVGHPFYIKTETGIGDENQFTDGVTNNGDDSGEVVFEVPEDAPDELFYQCGVHAPMNGSLLIVDE